MSLFPCVNSKQNEDGTPTEQLKDTAENWLRCSSYKADLVQSQQTVPAPENDLSKSIEDQLKHLRQIETRVIHPSHSDTPNSDDSPPHKDRRKRKHAKHSKKHDRKKKHRARSPGNSPPRVPPPSRKVFLEEIRDLGYKDAHRIDRKYDKDNYAFGSLNKNHLSRYRTQFKIPLGLSRLESFSWRKDTSTSKEPVRYHSKSVRKDNYNPGSMLQSTTNIGLADSAPHVINLPPVADLIDGKKSEDNPHGILDVSTVLWTQGKAPDSTNTADVTSSYLTSSVAQKIASINRELRDEPGNIALWLELVNTQDGLLQQRTEDDTSRLFTLQNIHDKKLAILEQGIKKNPTNLQLKLKHLELCGKTLSPKEVSEEWRKLTFSHINDVDVWRGYLNHIKNAFNKFTVGVMVTAYTKCIKSLRQVSQGVIKSHPCKPNTLEHMIEILLELCDLLHLANCTEKAVAIAQAMIEFNLFHPPSLANHETSIQSFQEFYDSGVPRFGEPGAKGWCNVKPGNYSVIPAPLKPTAQQDLEEEETILTSCREKSRADTWLNLEKSRQTSHWLPWRPSANESDADCEDPHRLVISDDFIELLFYAEDQELRSKIYFTFLQWLGLQSHGQTALHGQVLSGVNQINKTLANECYTYDWHEYILNNLFIAHCTSQILQYLTCEDKSQLIMSQLFHQLHQVKRVSDKKEKKRKSKEFKHYAKSILSLEENRNNQKLWLCYAECNRELGLYTDMTQVYNALLASQADSGQSPGELFTSDRCNLWWQAVSGEIALPQPSPDRILSLCCWLVNGGTVSVSPTASQKLMLLRHLESQIQNMWENVQDCTDKTKKLKLLSSLSTLLLCQHISVVLVNGLAALEQALSHWSPQLELLLSDVTSPLLAEYYTALVQMLKYVQQHLYQSSTPTLRSVLQAAISNIPECYSLLEDYLEVERATHVTTRTRQFFTSYLSDAGTVRSLSSKEMIAVHSILFELERLHTLSPNGDNYNTRGINHRIRSVCERCLHTICPTSVLLWRLYMYHEAKYGDTQKTESIFYAAVQSCPYAKYLYTDAIQYLPHKLKEIIDIAEEKEVRIHTPIDELDILLHQE